MKTVNATFEAPFDFCDKCPYLKAVECNVVYLAHEIVSRKYTCANQRLCYWVRNQMMRNKDTCSNDR